MYGAWLPQIQGCRTKFEFRSTVALQLLRYFPARLREVQVIVGPRRRHAAGALQRLIELVDPDIVCDDAVFHITFGSAVAIGVERHLIGAAGAVLVRRRDP